MRDLEELTHRFTDAFNREDLDAVMACFTEDAIYDQLDGTVSRGKDAIRAAFVPQFRGDFGTIRFLTEECFVDEARSRALIRWECTLENARGMRAWRGLDVLHFADDRVREKHTYGKTAKPLLVTR